MAIPQIGEDVPLGNVARSNIPAVGNDVPLVDPSLLAVKELPKEPISASAIKDFKGIAEGLLNLGKAAGYVFVPGEENTLLKIGKYLEDAYEKGELDDNAWGFAKEAIMAPLRNIGADLTPIVQEGITKGTPKAAENIARRPFSFTLDVLSALGLGKAGVGLTKGAASLATGKSMGAIGRRVAEAEAIGGAKTAKELADELADAFNAIDDKIKVAAEDAKAVLPKDPALGFPAAQINKLLDDAITEVGQPISDASENAIAALTKYKERINKIYKDRNLTAPEVKQIIMDLDDDIDWNTPKSKKANTAIKGLRKATDKMLKDKFPNYGERMEPLANLMKTREEASTLLKVVRRQGEWEVPDIAVSRMDRLFKGGYPKKKSLDVLERFGKESGLDIAGEMDLSTFRTQFLKPEPRATRTALTGGAIGFWTGGVPGAAKGAAIGAALDKYGGRALSEVIDVAPGGFRAVGRAAGAIPAGAMAIPAAAEAIKQAYKSGKISKEEAAKQLRANHPKVFQ